MPLIIDEKFGVLHLWNRISGGAGACVSSTGGCDVKEIENARFNPSLHSYSNIGDADMAKKVNHDCMRMCQGISPAREHHTHSLTGYSKLQDSENKSHELGDR